ncbi:hypothetical protein DLAC_01594 [Tieghemostelium lacteum]|uniref:GH16 domain-containing protein n=1 Tax=Tieghemostelium lacteum TaxID=361077 RepID=A0A152A5U2_TIELA|nr:hypothetical protein DLAC_01594 [Tieghemostelium lacteum]|eukprot:KYR01593.1 hypothetical protein DLAC_01594 [Tieghemostelium lacteum]
MKRIYSMVFLLLLLGIINGELQNGPLESIGESLKPFIPETLKPIANDISEEVGDTLPKIIPETLKPYLTNKPKPTMKPTPTPHSSSTNKPTSTPKPPQQQQQQQDSVESSSNSEILKENTSIPKSTISPTSSSNTKCYRSYRQEMKNDTETMVFKSLDDTYGYRKCMLSEDLVKFGEDTLSLSIDHTGCPGNCNSLDYSCSQIQSTMESSYGTYSCLIKHSNLSAVVTSCFVKNQHSEIFFRIFGSKVQYGYDKITKTHGLPNNYEFNNYTIILTNHSIEYIVNSQKVDEVTMNSVPKPPYHFNSAIFNDETARVDPNKLPVQSEVKAMSYQTSTHCKEGQGPLFDWDPKSPLWYFMSNCTYTRIQWIYNDTLSTDWTDKSLSMRQMDAEELVKNGLTSIRFDLAGDTTIFFQSTVGWSVKQHKYLTFWFNAGDTPHCDMLISVTGLVNGNNNTVVGSFSLNDYIGGGVRMNRWYKVILPLHKMKLLVKDVEYLTGFVFKNIYSTYLGQVYIDDIYLSNGTNCVDETQSIMYYQKGKLVNGANSNYSIGSVDIQSTGERIQVADKQFKTIEWRVSEANKLVISFENGTINTNQHEAIRVSVLFQPSREPSYYPEDALSPYEPKSLLAVQIDQQPYLAIGLSEYVGGKFPNGTWLDLTIPFSDLSCGDGQEINAIQFYSEIQQYTGVFYFGRIEAVKYADPPKETSFSIPFINSINFNLILLLCIILLLIS